MRNLNLSPFVVLAVMLSLTATNSLTALGGDAAVINARANAYNGLITAQGNAQSGMINAQANMYNATANARTNYYNARSNAQTSYYNARSNARIGMTNALGNTQAANITAQAKAIEAQAHVLNAQSTMITAIANARATEAKTLQTVEQTRGMAFDNDLKKAKTFYDKRSLYDTYQAAHKPKRPEKAAASAYKAASFKRSDVRGQSTIQDGRIYWPRVLEKDEFAEQRTKLDELFAQWHDSAYASDIREEVHRVAEQMRVALRSMIRNMSPTEYVETRNFIDNLAYEAQVPRRMSST